MPWYIYLFKVFHQKAVIIRRQVYGIVAMVFGVEVAYLAADDRGMDKIVVFIEMETDMMVGWRVIFEKKFGKVPAGRPGCFFGYKGTLVAQRN